MSTPLLNDLQNYTHLLVPTTSTYLLYCTYCTVKMNDANCKRERFGNMMTSLEIEVLGGVWGWAFWERGDKLKNYKGQGRVFSRELLGEVQFCITQQAYYLSVQILILMSWSAF